MIERAIADGLPAGLVLADSAYGDNSEFAGACAARVWATPSAYTVRPRVRLDLLGRRIGDPWRSVIWPTPSGEVVSAGDLARRNEGKCRRASPPNVWCSRRRPR